MDMPMLLRAAMYLRMEDVATWRTADTATKEAFDVEGDENVWRCCAQNEFGDMLLATYALYASPHRVACFKFHTMLARANFMLSCEPLHVFNLQEAALIERRLRNADRVCSAHRAASGRDAKVLLGEFYLHEARMGTMFRFGGEEMPSTIAGLPPGILEIALFLDKGMLMSCAMYGVERDGVLEKYHEAAGVQLILNADSAESDFFMSYRGIPLILDGQWRSSKCGCCSKRFASDDDGSFLCVLSLFDGEANAAEHSHVNALSLEFYEG
eukprot:TRINITY_DN10288_c0_g1_i1.p1 TRINITY_DN10288_c0_g1~~TRINITY_DN10288_c0_g1_i1.p1  ORF type:complete len:269 (-),score=51.21 TRINITY_DN10288_c0_g1_i1:369-1175(-)